MKTLKETPAVYLLINTQTTELYVGSSINPQSRIKKHFYDLKAGIHSNVALLTAFENNPSSIVCVFIEYCFDSDRQSLKDREQFYIRELKGRYKLLNQKNAMCYSFPYQQSA